MAIQISKSCGAEQFWREFNSARQLAEAILRIIDFSAVAQGVMSSFTSSSLAGSTVQINPN